MSYKISDYFIQDLEVLEGKIKQVMVLQKAGEQQNCSNFLDKIRLLKNQISKTDFPTANANGGRIAIEEQDGKLQLIGNVADTQTVAAAEPKQKNRNEYTHAELIAEFKLPEPKGRVWKYKAGSFWSLKLGADGVGYDYEDDVTRQYFGMSAKKNNWNALAQNAGLVVNGEDLKKREATAESPAQTTAGTGEGELPTENADSPAVGTAEEKPITETETPEAIVSNPKTKKSKAQKSLTFEELQAMAREINDIMDKGGRTEALDAQIRKIQKANGEQAAKAVAVQVAMNEWEITQAVELNELIQNQNLATVELENILVELKNYYIIRQNSYS